MQSEFERRLGKLAEEAMIELSKDAQERLWRYCTLLLDWNRKINLTGAGSTEVLLTEHLPDALGAARLLPPQARVVDVGSGGGLPALPCAIARPDCRFTLVEPRSKRVAFLRTAARTLVDNVAVQAGRLEELDGGAPFDVAMSRATFSPREWLERGRTLVGATGQVFVFTVADPRGRAGLPVPLAEAIIGPHAVSAYDVTGPFRG